MLTLKLKEGSNTQLPQLYPIGCSSGFNVMVMQPLRLLWVLFVKEKRELWVARVKKKVFSPSMNREMLARFWQCGGKGAPLSCDCKSSFFQG